MKHNLILREPELSFDSLHQELNNLLRDTFGDTELFSPSKSKSLSSSIRPAIELKQNDKEFKAKIQLPGVKKEDINIELDSDYITISAESREEKETHDENEKVHACELRYGKFMRTMSLDNPIKVDDSRAEYKDGILTITMPKQKHSKKAAKRLNIK